MFCGIDEPQHVLFEEMNNNCKIACPEKTIAQGRVGKLGFLFQNVIIKEKLRRKEWLTLRMWLSMNWDNICVPQILI
jgi:hypothetical protein